MSWPHILSFSRIVAGPIVAALILSRPGDTYLIASVLFAVASLTDLVDGKLARYSQSVSPLGIFLDTTSDKVLVSLSLIGLALAGLCQAWVPLVVVGREFLISGLRSYAASRDRIISAHIWGKGKVALTMASIVFILAAADATSHGILSHTASPGTWRAFGTASSWLLGIAALLTVISGLRYVIDAWPLFQASPVSGETVVEERPRIAAGGKR